MIQACLQAVPTQHIYSSRVWRRPGRKVLARPNDKKLLYVGSDNVYPNYNEEYGVWIDDKPAIDAWFEKYWTPRWIKATDANMDPRAGRNDFGPTMIDYVKWD